MYARNLVTLPEHDALLEDEDKIAEVRHNIDQGDIYVLKNAVPKEKVLAMREYLTTVGTHSLPNYEPIEVGCPNFHRVVDWDPRAVINGCFHQFSFFTWNQDTLRLFDLFKNVFYIKNLIAGNPREKFLNQTPDEGCSARLCFHFYPRGIGALHKHTDPVGGHQLTETVMVTSKKGVDYHKGGGYVEKEDGSHIRVEEEADIGDIICWHGYVPHGVDYVDPDEDEDWNSFKGRWITVCTVNGVTADANVAASKDLGR